jgi:hypothetical protein
MPSACPISQRLDPSDHHPKFLPPWPLQPPLCRAPGHERQRRPHSRALRGLPSTVRISTIPGNHQDLATIHSRAATSPETVGTLAPRWDLPPLSSASSDLDLAVQNKPLTQISMDRSGPSRSHKIQRPWLLIRPKRYQPTRAHHVGALC